MLITKRTKRSIFLFLISIIIIVLFSCYQFVVFRSSISIILSGVLVITWGAGLWLRIIDSRIRNLFILMISYVLVWFLIQFTKYNLIYSETGTRYLWYLFYIPLTMIPLVSYFISLSIGRDRDEKLPLLSRLLIIPAISLLVFTITNDFHQKVFVFYNGIENGNHDYSYCWGFYIIIAWIVSIMLLSLITAILRSTKGDSGKYIWIPILILVLGIIYGLLNTFTDLFYINGISIKFQQVFSFILIIFWESFIQIGVIGSNRDYDYVFRKSSSNAVLLDNSNNIVYASDNFDSTDAIYELNEQPMIINGKKFHKEKLQGGYVCWSEDISVLLDMQNRLNETLEELSEEGEILRAEKEIKKREAALESRTRIYDELSRSLEDKCQRISELLDKDMDEHLKLAIVAVIGVYIKRWSNIKLLSESGDMDVHELVLAVRESMDYLELLGIHSELSVITNGSMSGEKILSLYEKFESSVESFIKEDKEGGVFKWQI